MQLVQFNANAQAVTSYNEKTRSTNCRLLSAKEFKEQKGLKGSEAKRAYNDYLKTQGKVNTAGLAAALTTGDLLVKGVMDTPNGMTVRLIKAANLKDPTAKTRITKEAVAEMTEAEKAELMALLAA